MFVNNNKGMTLIELLAALTISFIIVGVVSGVLIQSFKSMDISDRNANLRQEANLIINMFSSAQLNPVCEGSLCQLIVRYERLNEEEWGLKIGDYYIQSKDYEIFLEIVVLDTAPNQTTIDSKSTTTQLTQSFNPRQKLQIKTLRLTDKQNSKQTYEVSTIISRL